MHAGDMRADLFLLLVDVFSKRHTSGSLKTLLFLQEGILHIR